VAREKKTAAKYNGILALATLERATIIIVKLRQLVKVKTKT